MEVARDVWSLLEEQVPLVGPLRGGVGTPWWAAPPPRWWAWRDLGRLAKRPSAIILNSGTVNADVNSMPEMKSMIS